MKVLVCDDQPERYQEVVDAIADSGVGADIIQLVGDDLKRELERLFQRVEDFLSDPHDYVPRSDLVFDVSDLAIFDNNLAHLDIKGARLTAESIVGYVRAFTAAPYIVSLNKNPDVDFDLRYLVGDYETRADLALNTEHLSNRGLWTGRLDDGKDGFLPWYWPTLNTVVEKRRRQIEFVQGHLGHSVFDAVGLPASDDALGFLSLHARGALSPKAESDSEGDGVPIDDVTFLKVFVDRSRSLPAKEDRERLVAAQNPNVNLVIARVVAADLDLWFRRDIVGPQEMLVDVPHLLMRMPFLLGDHVSDVSDWNKTVSALEPPFGLNPALYLEHLAGALFAHDIWLRSPAFTWPMLKANDKLEELFFSSKQSEWVDVVFCEDRSVFLERASGEGGGPSEFSAEFEGSWGRRYVARLEDVQYSPRSRFAV